jgi:hypothetical protein
MRVNKFSVQLEKVICIKLRYVYIPALILVSSCFGSSSTYSVARLPIPEINYLNTPYEQIKDINTAALFDASTSYDPDGGQIIEWMWDVYKYNGTSWDFLFSLSGPDKAIVKCRFPEIGLYKARLWVCAGDVSQTSRWNQVSDVKECFVYVIYRDISADKYVAFGSGITFTYIIRLPNDIQVKEACLTVFDENDLILAELWIKNPVIGKEAKIEWDGKINKGPNAGEFVPAGHFRINFRVIPFHNIPEKPILQEE